MLSSPVESTTPTAWTAWCAEVPLHPVMNDVARLIADILKFDLGLTYVRPLCVKMALICKNGVKVRVRVRVRVRDRIVVRVSVRARVRITVSVPSLYRQGPHFYR